MDIHKKKVQDKYYLNRERSKNALKTLKKKNVLVFEENNK